MSLTPDEWDAVQELMEQLDYVTTIDDEHIVPRVMRMTVLTENNGWAIVWMNDRYYLRHVACGSYLLRAWRLGCLCNANRRKQAQPMREPTKVDDMILKKFKLLIKGDIK